jgi:hypothetical protein
MIKFRVSERVVVMPCTTSTTNLPTYELCPLAVELSTNHIRFALEAELPLEQDRIQKTTICFTHTP